MASHSGQKPFSCSICNLSFTRLDNLKTHIKSHNKEKAAADTPATTAAATSQEVRNVLQLQQYQLPSGPQQEIQLVMTEDGTSINFVPSQGQEISIVTTEEEEGQSGVTGSSHPRLTLLSQPTGNMTLVDQDQQSLAEQNPHIQTISMLEGSVAYQPDQMHIISLSKEAIEQLQVHQGHLQQPLQVMQAETSQQQQEQQHRLAGGASRDKASQGIHISSQSSQPISISQTSEEMSGHHIQGQTFQIQAGTVSYLYTTGLPRGS